MSESNIFGVKLKAPKGSRLVVQSQPDVSSSTSENGVDDSKDFDKESYKAIKASFQQQPKKTVLHSLIVKCVCGGGDIPYIFPVSVDVYQKWSKLQKKFGS